MLSYPGKDTAHLTDEQIILIGSRYNRGTQREIQALLILFLTGWY
jgi:hypothetical protein